MRTLLGLVLILGGAAVLAFVGFWAAVSVIFNVGVGDGLVALVFGGLIAALLIWGGVRLIRSRRGD